MKTYYHMIRRSPYLFCLLITLVLTTSCSVESWYMKHRIENWYMRYKSYMSVLPGYPVIETPYSNQKSKIYVTYPYSAYAGSKRVDFDDLIYMELPEDIYFFRNRDEQWPYISKSGEVLIIRSLNKDRDTTSSGPTAPKIEWVEREDIEDNDWGNYVGVSYEKKHNHTLKGMWLRPWRYNYKISDDKFCIEYYNIKRKHFSRYNKIFNSLKVLNALSFDQMKAIDREIDLTYWWKKDNTIELHRAVEKTRPGLYEENKSKHFKINKITRCRADLYLIEAARNDSTFLIFSLDGWQHIEGSKTIKCGHSYDIKIKKLYPDDYPQENENRHISCYWPERFYFGLERNHYMVYKALDLNGLHLEIAN